MCMSACVCECMWYGWKTPLTNYLIGCFCTQFYTADGDKKAIFPIMFEDVDFSTNELARGVKFVIMQWCQLDHVQAWCG